jgi:hypothetical protein
VRKTLGNSVFRLRGTERNLFSLQEQDMPISQCDICSTQYDSREQTHRRGIDCVGPLADQIKKQHEAIENLINAVHDLALAREALKLELQSDIAVLIERHENLARRVVRIESPRTSLKK